MLRRKTLPVGALVMIMILALASIGVGYGLWSKVLLINGTVETGEVKISLSLDEVDEGDEVLPPNGSNPGFWEEDNDCDDPDTKDSDDCEVEGKDIAECTAVLLDAAGNIKRELPKDGLTGFGGQTIEITVTNGYPSFNCWVQFDVRNDGTIPVKVFQPVISNPNPTAITVDLVEGFHGPRAGATSSCYHDNFYGGVGLHPQVEPGDLVNCVIHAHVNQEAQQGRVGQEAYTFQATICAHQWNEATTVENCISKAP